MAEEAKTILIVDDDPDIVHAISTILSMEGYQPIQAYSGKECFEVLETKIPNLILLDYMLPDMTGRDIVLKVRNSQSLSHMPIILISAAHGVEEIGNNLDIEDWIEKPFELDFLLQKVSKNI